MTFTLRTVMAVVAAICALLVLFGVGLDVAKVLAVAVLALAVGLVVP